MNENPQLGDLNEGDAQLFRPHTNLWARAGIFAALGTFIALIAVLVTYYNSAYVTAVEVPIPQPVEFSHAHHVSQLGIDCRYCHTSVEESSFAGIPPTHTCMSCHSQIWTDSPLLSPVRQSYIDNQAILWNRVYDLPGFVYFNHSIHVDKGVGCATCHGRVDEMVQVYEAQELTMGWCLNCHRDPVPYLRPRNEVFNMTWSLPEEQQLQLGRELIDTYNIRVGYLTECYVCHR